MTEHYPPHVTAGLRWARGVVSGEIPAGHYVKRACQRQLDDLERQADPSFPYRFDGAAGDRICRFLELLPHVKGEWAGQKIKLHPSQQFEQSTIFGWLRKTDQMRRFRKVFKRKPRKNAKSTETAGVGLYMAFADKEPGAEAYSGATTRDQAMEVFKPAWLMVKRTPDLRARFGLELSGTDENPGTISCPATGSKFEAVIGKPGYGPSPHIAITDEYHEHASSEQLDAFDTGMGARRQPMAWVITTAGTNLGGPCYELDRRCQQVLDGVIVDDRQFAIMYGIDPGDDWTLFENWIKANPLYGVSVKEDFLAAQWQECLTNASRQNILRTMHLNEWCNARTAWMNMAWWERCGNPLLAPADVAGRRLYVGLDGASRIDLASRVMTFTGLVQDAPAGSGGPVDAQPPDGDVPAVADEGQEARRLVPTLPPTGFRRHYWVFGKHYCPASQAHDPKNSHYAGWEHVGRLQVTPGDEIDFTAIEQDLRDDIMGHFRLEELAYDPWRMTQLAQDMAKEGVTTVELRPLVQNFSPAMKEVIAAVKSGRFHHDGDPVLTWFVSNIVAREDNKGEVYPCKESKESPNKIDGGVAMLMGICRAMVAPNDDQDQAGFYETNDLTVL